MNVSANELNFVARTMKDQYPLITEVERHSSRGQTASNGHGRDKRLVHLERLDLAEKSFVGLIKSDQPIKSFQSTGHLSEVAEFRRWLWWRGDRCCRGCVGNKRMGA